MDNEYQIPQTSKNKLNILLLLGAVVLVVALTGIIYYETKVNKPKSLESHEISFTVQKGSSTREIAQQLNSQNIIGNTTVFLIYTSLHQAGGKIQAGNYALNSNMAIPEIVEVLTQGKVVSNDRVLTIVEGWTNKQLASYLVSRQILKDSSEFDKLLSANNFTFKYNDDAKQFAYQGFLFPDTYKTALDAEPQQLIQKMLKNFESKVTDQMLADIQNKNLDMQKIIILASIIEKEVGRNKSNLTEDDLVAMQKEREIVASVFYNRLKADMGLESDATVNYITGKKDRQPLLTDTKVKSPYNTYLNKGLPPTPISNPGLGSIKASIYPATTDYLYFINKPDGEAVFAKTYSEHLANKAKYLK